MDKLLLFKFILKICMVLLAEESSSFIGDSKNTFDNIVSVLSGQYIYIYRHIEIV